MNKKFQPPELPDFTQKAFDKYGITKKALENIDPKVTEVFKNITQDLRDRLRYDFPEISFAQMQALPFSTLKDYFPELEESA